MQSAYTSTIEFLLSTSRKLYTFNGCDTRRSNGYFKTGLNLQRFRIQHHNLPLGIARVDVLPSSVEWSDNIQIALSRKDNRNNNNNETKTDFTSLSSGRHLWVPPTSTTTAAYLIGHTRNLKSFRGSNWFFSIGDGNRYLCSQSPVSKSQMHTLLSVEADKI